MFTPSGPRPDPLKLSRPKSDSRSTIRELESRLDKLELVTEALWRLLCRSSDLTDDDLLQEMTDLDLEDGKYDGKVARVPFKECPNCGRKNAKKHPNCMYCGQVLLMEPFE